MTESDADRVAAWAIGSVFVFAIVFMVLVMISLVQNAMANADPAYAWVGNELTWTDPVQGCRYLIGDDGGRTTMLLPSGLPDCTKAVQ